jgi:hypothetical protein
MNNGAAFDRKIHSFQNATVQALALEGVETALCCTLFSIQPVQTCAECLHSFAAAVRIPVGALPTGTM